MSQDLYETIEKFSNNRLPFVIENDYKDIMQHLLEAKDCGICDFYFKRDKIVITKIDINIKKPLRRVWKKMTTKKVTKEIVMKVKDNISTRNEDLAAELGVCKTTVSFIKKGNYDYLLTELDVSNKPEEKKEVVLIRDIKNTNISEHTSWLKFKKNADTLSITMDLSNCKNKNIELTFNF